MSIFETITTPQLVINKAIVTANIHRMAEKAHQQDVIFRPHFKTHQSAQVAEWFRQAGVSAITVSSLGMATYFAQHDWQDITVAFPVNLHESVLINQLAATIQLGLLAEDEQVIKKLDHLLINPLNVWLKIDVGYHRTGLDWQQMEIILKCARAIQESRYLSFKGLLTHGGNSYHTPTEQIPALFNQSIQRMQSVRNELAKNGFLNLLISVGDTPGCCLADTFQGADEIRPGNFVYFDAQQLALGACSFAQIAAVIACPIVALHPQRNEAVIYGGAVHLSKDLVTFDGVKSYGLVCKPAGDHWGAFIAGAYVKSLSQEHGVISMPEPVFSQLQIGDLLCIIPAHSCLAANLLGNAITTDAEHIPMFTGRTS